MKELMNPDNRVMNLINRIAGCVWLNLLWFLCCLPIVTIGASTTALFTVTLKMARDEEGSLTRQFFEAFQSNFRFATKVWLILLPVAVFFAIDGWFLWHMRYANAFWTVLTAIYIVALAAFCIVLLYIFPLMAHFENTVAAMLRNSLLIGVRYLVCTALMAAVHFAMILVVVRFFTPAIIFGEGLCAFLCSLLLTNVLRACEGVRETEA